MSLDLDAIRARYDFAKQPKSNPLYAFTCAKVSADDVPALLAEVERLRADLDSIREVEVRRLALKPGDVIVLTTDRRLTYSEFDGMRDATKDWFPGHEVRIISEATMTIVEPIGGAS